MTMPNAKVAERFVAGQPAKGSHLSATISILGNICASYAVRIARIKDGRLFLDVTPYSNTTMEHKRLITSAWGRRQVAKGLPYDSGLFHVRAIFGDASDDNVAYWVNNAADHMTNVLNNRCKPATRYFAYCKVHKAIDHATSICYLLDPSVSQSPYPSTLNRLKAFIELCSVVPVHEAATAEEARLSPEQIVTIRAVMELMKE